ncbi:MAG: sigma-70 family RNA polymerase sigma factor [Phycisphaera sp.]|nr:MAG: sigma-70 family RNA polymerase sigma factor [Phycisphaera sp.]
MAMGSFDANREPEGWVADLSASGAIADAAFADLTTVISRGLRRALAGRGVSEADLEDFVQESVVRIHQKLDTFRGDSKFTTWAIAISIRVALTHLRKRRWNDVSLEALSRGNGLAELQTDESAAIQVERNQEISRVLRVMQRVIQNDLTERQRVVLLAKLAGMPKESIADQLGLTSNALYKATHDARKALKKRLIEEGIDEEEVREAFMDASSTSEVPTR